jgi:uncharacterized membrane protein YozB (DUF420 family)
MLQFFSRPGFLGTHAALLSDLTLILILLTAISFSVGFYLARRRRFAAHRWVQTITVCLNALIVLSVMVTSFAIHILPGIPAKLLQGDYGVTTVHAFVGLLGLLLGIFVMLRGNELVPRRLRFRKFKPFMRTAYTLYMLATAIGVLVYVEVYIVGI